MPSFIKKGTVVGDYINTNFFIYVLIVYYLLSNYKFTSNQREAFLIDSFLDFYV